MFCHIRLFFADKRSGILAYCYINCTGAVFGDVALFVAVVAFDLLIGGLLGAILSHMSFFLTIIAFHFLVFIKSELPSLQSLAMWPNF